MIGRVARSILVAGVVAAAAARGESPAASPPRHDEVRQATANAVLRGAPTLRDVPALIEQLGSPRFADRRRAEEQLLRLGPDAYDLINQAVGFDEDPEVNERLAYIKLCLQIDWVRPDDPLPVRRLLSKFRALQEEGRIACVAELAELPSGQGIAPLVRIARFDGKENVANSAALAIVEMSDEDLKRSGALSRAFESEAGTGSRPALGWIRTRLTGLDRPAVALVDEADAVARQFEVLLAAGAEDEDYEGREGRIAARLLRDYLQRCEQFGSPEQLAAALASVIQYDERLRRRDDRMQLIDQLCEPMDRAGNLMGLCILYVDDEPHGQSGLCFALDWCNRRQRWDVLEQVLPPYVDLARQQRGPRYLLAASLRGRDRQAEAEGEAAAAFDMEIEDPFDTETTERRYIGDLLAERGCIEWAIREYRAAIDASDLADIGGVYARSNLAQWLHDDQQFAAAAETLGEFCDAVREDAKVRTEFHENWPYSGVSPRSYLAQLDAQRHLYAAYQCEADGDADKQLQHLEQAVELHEENPDILIALYRLQADDPEQQRRTVYRIERVGRRMRSLIHEVDDDDSQLASAYNQYAWLVSNTEGDYEKALEYSLKSLELAPEEPSFLDTLGRCYYAVGDLDKAVIAQRRACEFSPHVQVMQRQLAFFEDEQAAQK